MLLCSVQGKMQRKLIGEVESKVKDTIKRYKLFSKEDRIAVAASGGKDSTTLLHILHKRGYNITALTVDVAIGSYTRQNLQNLRGFCAGEGIGLIELSFREEFGYSLCYIKSILHSRELNYKSCAICGVLRRYIINKHAKRHRFTRVATGHNMDDEAQATLMNIFRNDMPRFMREGPVVGVLSSPHFVQRVKPLYFVSEKEISQYSKQMGFPVVYEKCPCGADAYRNNARGFIAAMERLKPGVTRHILKFTLAHTKKKQPGGELSLCKACGEPSTGERCRTCEMIHILGETNESVSG